MSQMFSAVFFFYFSTILDLFAWIPLPSSFLLSSLWLLPLSWRSSPVLFQNSLGITKGAQLLTLTLFPLISTTPWHSRCNPTLGRIWDQGRGRTGQIELDACAQAKAEQLDREVLGAFEIGWVLKKKKMCRPDDARSSPAAANEVWAGVQEHTTGWNNNGQSRWWKARGVTTDGASRCFIRGTGYQRLGSHPRQWQINYTKKEEIHSQGAPQETERGRRAATCKITIELTICGGCRSWTGHKKVLLL